jgi:hypothetical protein
MMRLILALMAFGFAAAGFAFGEPACTAVMVRPHVEAAAGELSFADLLAPGSCPQLYRAAARVSLGVAPRAGSVRVIEGAEMRRLIGGFEERGLNLRAEDSMRIPERIVVQRAGAVKSCVEIAKFLATADSSPAVPGGSRWLQDLDCAAAGRISEDAALELVKIAWNGRLQRREFELRCGQPGDCNRFLVWVPEKARPDGRTFPRTAGLGDAMDKNGDQARLIKRGQTAILTWDEAGIRIVLPVTCLEAGELGQFVRVRFKNAPRTLRAEITGAGSLRASL